MGAGNEMNLRYMYATLLFLVAGGLLPLLFLPRSDWGQLDAPLVMSLAVLVYSAAMLSYPVAANKERILDMTFWLFAYVFLGLVPLVQLAESRFPWPDTYGDGTLVTAQLMTLAGLLAYHAGTLLGKPSKASPPAPGNPAADFAKPGGTRRFLVVSGLAILISGALLVQSGGIHSLFLPRNALQNVYETKSQGLIADQLIKVPVFVCLIFGLTLWKRRLFRSALPKLTTLLLLALCLVVSNPISNARYWFGSVMLTLCLLFVPWRRIGRFGWTAGYLLLFIVVFPYTDLFRNNLDGDIQTAGISDIFVQKGDYDAFQMSLNAVEYVGANGTTHGKQLLGALLFWVPRSLWEAKPLSSGQLLGEASGYFYTNLSCPLWAEGYLNGGLSGVVLLFAVYGFVSRRLQSKYEESRRLSTMSIYRIIVPFLSAYQVFLLRGDLMNALAYMSSFLLFAYLFARRSGGGSLRKSLRGSRSRSPGRTFAADRAGSAAFSRYTLSDITKR